MQEDKETADLIPNSNPAASVGVDGDENLLQPSSQEDQSSDGDNNSNKMDTDSDQMENDSDQMENASDQMENDSDDMQVDKAFVKLAVVDGLVTGPSVWLFYLLLSIVAYIHILVLCIWRVH
jgi:hypothetical protein